MASTRVQTIFTITHGVFSATVKQYGPACEPATEYRISLPADGLGHGMLRATTEAGIETAFENFIDEAMADIAEAHAKQYGEWDIEDWDGYDGENY